MTEKITMLLAAAEQFSGAVSDVLEAARDGEIAPHGNIGAGDTLTIAVDGLRLLIEAIDDTDDPDAAINQLHGATIRFLEDRA